MGYFCVSPVLSFIFFQKFSITSVEMSVKVLKIFFFLNRCLQYQFLLPSPRSHPPPRSLLIYFGSATKPLQRTENNRNQPVRWLQHPGEPAALPSNYVNDNLKILEATWKPVYIPDTTCLFTYWKHFCMFALLKSVIYITNTSQKLINVTCQVPDPKAQTLGIKSKMFKRIL